MRTAISTAGVLAAVLLIGACFDPTRPCSTSSDCVNGTCDQGTKTCVSGGNPNDKTPPGFSIVVAPPPARQATATLIEYDPASPDGGADAFRRDESLSVTVTSTDQDVDAGSVRLRVYGVSTNPVTGLEVPLAPCAPGSLAASNPFCRLATLSLASLPFEAFRAVVPLEVTGSDLSNNLGKADAGVNVTRWKWRYSAGAPIYTTPAIADDGTIVFGTSDGGSGSLYALTPAGTEKWAPLPLGPTEASVSIGSTVNPAGLVYVATSQASGSRINAIRLADGTDAGVCLGASGSGFSKPILSGLALVSTPGDNGPYESAVGLAGGTRLVTFRPGAQGTTDPFCLEAGAPFQQSQLETIATDGSSLYLGAQDNVLRSFVFDATTSINWIKNPTWGVSGAVLIGDAEQSAVAIDGPDLFLSVHPYGLVRVARATGIWIPLGPDGGVQRDFSGPALGTESALFGAGPDSSPLVLAWRRQTGDFLSSQSIGLVRAVPSLGADQVAYSLTAIGGLEVRGANLDLLWSTRLSPTGGFRGSPVLDCERPSGSRGVLYAASDNGELTSVLVDSPGLDPTAPWPKYQHDVRNTGNPTTPIQSCP